jgi:tryptophan 2,3-dioxygenase
MSEAALNYSSYLALDQLLTAQHPLSHMPATGAAEHDEMLFIIIHQVYELWFKQLLHELDYACKHLYANDQPRALHTIHRMLTILKTVVSQIDILETMTPLEFISFRAYLGSSSGFQSSQFRELEFALGYKRRHILNHFPDEMQQKQRLQQRYSEPTLWDAFLAFLHTNGYAVPPDQLQRDVTATIAPSPAIQALLIELYRTHPEHVQICEHLVDLDEGLQEWRYRHVKMVERTIGTKMGTGGSAGVAYLHSTLQPLFPDLWAIRAHF